jgi:2-polyprenyl-3-methyl-5-hydroxy-6-metoxy-1,4-benzoquinol methylase
MTSDRSKRTEGEASDSSKAEDVAAWWAANPQSYGDLHGQTAFAGVDVSLGTREFFQKADATLCEWNHNLHSEDAPFGKLFPFQKFRGKKVLEVGCGMGGMAAMWARAGAVVTAVDLNPVAVEQTRRRFQVFGLHADVRQSDGRSLPFEGSSFDYVYSWGVLHHSPNLSDSIRELLRTVKPGGEFGVMLYHRHSLLYWYRILATEGWVHGERDFLDSLGLASRYTDGERASGNPHTWPITRREAHEIFSPHARSVNVRVLGTDIDGILASEILPVAWRIMPRIMRKSLARRFGWSLWISGTK